VQIELWEEDLDAGEMVRSDGWRLSVVDYEARQKARCEALSPRAGTRVTSIVIKRVTSEG
jgi:hypothetical protein